MAPVSDALGRGGRAAHASADVGRPGCALGAAASVGLISSIFTGDGWGDMSALLSLAIALGGGLVAGHGRRLPELAVHAIRHRRHRAADQHRHHHQGIAPHPVRAHPVGRHRRTAGRPRVRPRRAADRDGRRQGLTYVPAVPHARRRPRPAPGAAGTGTRQVARTTPRSRSSAASSPSSRPSGS